MKTLSLAWRNLWRTPRRTGVTLAAMTLAVLIMILYTSLMEGMLRDLERDIVEVEVGDIQIHNPNYRDAPSIYETIENSDQLVSRLEEKGFRVSARHLGGGLVAAGEASAGAMLLGVEVKRDRTVSLVSDKVLQGQWLDEADSHGVVLGKQLARALDVSVGEELIVLSQAADGSTANDLYNVRGVLDTVSAATDRAGLFMNQTSFEEFFATGGEAHQMIIRRPDSIPAARALEEIKAILAETGTRAEAKSWQELMPTLAAMVTSMRSAVSIVIFIIYIAIAILILNAMLMAVFERVRELGVLKAIGMQPGAIFRLMLAEAAIQALCAVALAVLLSLPALYWLSTRGINVGALGGTGIAGMTLKNTWYAQVTPFTFLIPVGLLLFLVAAAVTYPGLKAARLSPVEAMRHQ